MSPMSPSPEQVFFIQVVAGFVAVILAQIIKWAAASYGYKVGRRPVTVLLFVISLGLGFWWLAPQIPAFPVPTDDTGVYAGQITNWLAQLISLLGVLVGFAQTIYNLILQKVFDKIGDSLASVKEQAAIEDAAILERLADLQKAKAEVPEQNTDL